MRQHDDFKSIESLEARIVLSAIHINAGGASLLDSRGRSFNADSGFTSGSTVQIAPYDVARTTNDPLFYSMRQGTSFTFAQAVTNGKYALFLEFADVSSTAAGQRVFDVSVEGQTKLNDFDIFSKVGQGPADAECIDLTIIDGQLNLAFHSSVGLASVSAIVLLPTDAPTAVQPYAWDGLSETARTVLSASNLSSIGGSLYGYAADHHSNLPLDFSTLQSYLGDDIDYATLANPRTNTALPRGELADVERIAWVAARSDYIYFSYPHESSLTENTPWVYENPNRVNDGINVLFGDGHVAYLDRAAAAALIGFANVPPSDPPSHPAVGAADAKILASQSNLHAIANGLQIWSNEFNGRAPTDLGELLQAGVTSNVQTFINPRTSTVPPPANWSAQQKAVWIDTQSDYVYLGDERQLFRFSPYDVLAYEKPTGLTDGVNILFGDGRLEFRELGWFAETLAHQLLPTANPPWMRSSGGSYSLSGQSLTISSGTFILGGDIASLNTGINVTVAAGATLVSDADQHLASLIVNGTVQMQAPNGLGRTLRVGSLALGVAGTLDLENNDAIVDYASASPRGAIQSAVNLARNGGDWLGRSGITSMQANWLPRNHTLAVLEASEFRSIYTSNPNFNGEPVSGNSVLIKYTYYGDANFNGKVDGADYSRIDGTFNREITSGNIAGWFNGDFDGNGKVDGGDYSLIDYGFNSQGVPLRPVGILPIKSSGKTKLIELSA